MRSRITELKGHLYHLKLTVDVPHSKHNLSLTSWCEETGDREYYMHIMSVVCFHIVAQTYHCLLTSTLYLENKTEPFSDIPA